MAFRWLITSQLLLMTRAVGCSKNLRIKTNYDPRNPHVLPKKLVTVTCHKCGVMGHNMRRYKEKRYADKVRSKGGNNNKKTKTMTKKQDQ